MISVLIPVFNYNILELVSKLHAQCKVVNIAFEILCYDDCSDDKLIQQENKKIEELPCCSYVILEKNIGRSAIRNKLAKNAKYNWLLFLDADVMPKNKDFIKTYISSISEKSQVINGGILYKEKGITDSHLLRLVYGKKREALTTELRNENTYLSFLTLNFLIHKTVFKKVSFNEEIPNLRHEDTLFSYNLKQHNINVEHIENPVYHLGIESSHIFLKKSLDSVKAIDLFIKQNLLPSNYTKITKVYSGIRNSWVSKLLSLLFQKYSSKFENNLLGKKPSLFIFDLYRLSYYCHLNSKK